MLMARERKTMFTFASQLPTKRAVDTSEILINFMNKLPKKARKTITYDNGGRIFCS
jgi:IS30 family transposase